MINDIKKIKACIFFALMARTNDEMDRFSSLYSKEINANIIYSSNTVIFTDFSCYYNKEMGNKIFKKLFLTDKIVDCHKISSLKDISNNLETRFSTDNKRIFNIDPGYMNSHQIVLLTTKFSPHRIPIDAQLWAEITLLRHNRMWYPLLWTYKDYRSEEFISFFDEARIIIKKSG